MDYKKTTAPRTTVTRDMNKLCQEVGNVYETVAILSKRANQISMELKKELDTKLQEFSNPNDGIEELAENKEQIDISRRYEIIPKPTLIAIQEFEDHQLIYRNPIKEKQNKQ
ncbi:MAG: DNA-directed RNA polymerase subunit omega [Paludibacteraceae bacterium]|nr:DNA-directed RNA polymerase subunit omega [Paludibacteraceae bacterium]